jgi:membrane protease subunit HflK
MEQVFGNTNKILIDQEGGNNMMYLPLDQIMRNTPRERISSSGASLSTPAEQAQEAADAVRRGR